MRYKVGVWECSAANGKQMSKLLARLWHDEEGQDLTEYALLLVLLTLAAIGSLSGLAVAINGVFVNAAGNLNSGT
jgi:Flp pilus assembly pilin Flp